MNTLVVICLIVAGIVIGLIIAGIFIVSAFSKMRWMLSFVILPAALLALTGCAYLHSITKSNPDGTVQTRVTSYTIFDSQAELAKFRNAGQLTRSNEWAPGTSIGTLNQSASSTNLNVLLEAVVGAAVKAAVKP